MSDTLTGQSSAVQVGGFEVTSNTESPEQMVEALKPSGEGKPEPRVIKPIPDKPKETDAKLSKAAAKLGAAGGAASAARRAEAKSAESGDESGSISATDGKPNGEVSDAT